MKRYRIISELGKGATGVVYRAMRVEDGVTVALKKLVLPGHLDARQEEEFIARFKREAEAALSMKHPGIVRALDCGLDEGTFYIAYELIDGVTLEEALKSGRKFNPDEVADILAQAADALGFAHSQGVVHRDVSPGNVFIGSDGKVKIADFGVARFTSRPKVAGADEAIVGTPGYMAPEQVTGGDIDPRTDVFALGCIGYELLSGKPAFTGESVAQIIHQVLHGQPRPIVEINPRVPLALEEVIFRMLAKNPSYRYQSMAEVRTALDKVLETLPHAGKAEPAEDAGRAPYLLVVKGPHQGAKFDLLPSVTTIGRVVGDVLLPNDPEVAHQHAWITREENAWVLYDADTKTGTLVNAETISREEILPGDLITVGGTVLEFRGAGGHAGPFQEPVAAVTEAVKPKVAVDKKSMVRTSTIVLIVFALLLAMIAMAAGIVLGVVIPAKYMSALNAATEDRWDSAFSDLGDSTVGDPTWTSTAAQVVGEWQNDPLTEPQQFYAPDWLPSARRIKNEVDYRFQLLDLAERFLDYATSAPPVGERGPGSVVSGYTAVSALEPLVDGLTVPKGVSRVWVGRKNQLLGMLRTWKAAAAANSTGSANAIGFASEREQAVDHLLNGWYLYQDAQSGRNALQRAFNEFQMSWTALGPVLEARPGEPDASAVRGLAAFLAAKTLRDAGSPLDTAPWQRARSVLDQAGDAIGNTDSYAWERSIPRDFMQDFPSEISVRAQINALRSTLDDLLASIPQSSPPPPSSNQGQEGHYQTGP